MNSKGFLLVKALISIVLAVFMLFFAATFLDWFLASPIMGKVPDQLAGGLAQAAPALAQGVTDLHAGVAGVGKVMSAFFGALLLGVGLICYFASGATASGLRKKVILSLALADTLGFVFSLIAQIKGLFSGLGWIIVVLWGILALFLWFFFFTEKSQ